MRRYSDKIGVKARNAMQRPSTKASDDGGLQFEVVVNHDIMRPIDAAAGIYLTEQRRRRGNHESADSK